MCPRIWATCKPLPQSTWCQEDIHTDHITVTYSWNGLAGRILKHLLKKTMKQLALSRSFEHCFPSCDSKPSWVTHLLINLIDFQNCLESQGFILRKNLASPHVAYVRRLHPLFLAACCKQVPLSMQCNTACKTATTRFHAYARVWCTQRSRV